MIRLAKVDVERECRKISRFIENIDKVKENLKLNAKVIEMGVSRLAETIEESTEKRQLLAMINEMADSAERNASTLQDVQEVFATVIKRELGCK